MTSIAPGFTKIEGEEMLIMAINTLTPQQIAHALQLSMRTVYEYLRTGRIPGKKIGGRRYGKRWRVLEEDLKAFLREPLR